MSDLQVTIDTHIHVRQPPTKFIRECKRQLTFDNPAYLSAVQHNRSTRGIPKKIRPFEERNGVFSLPRGFWARFLQLAAEHGLGVSCEDRSVKFEPKHPPKSIQLREYQEPWVNNVMRSNQGLGVAAPGSGKTVQALEIYARLGQPCLWITHTGRLLRQARKRAESFLGIETGIIGKGKEDIKHFTVGTVQTLVRRDLENYKDLFGLVIVDEAHRTPARTFTEVISSFSAHYRYGLTATPYREDGLENLMFMVIGPQLANLGKDYLRSLGHLMTPTVIRRPTEFDFPYNPAGKNTGYQELCDALAEDEKRNKQIVCDVLVESSLSENNVCIVLVGRIKHGEALYQMLSEVLPSVGFVHSKMTAKKSDAILDSFETGKIRTLIATYKMLAEGFDYQPSNRLFLTAPFKGRTLIEQACGRVERSFPGKEDAIIFDYVDFRVLVLKRQADVRLDVYELNNTPVKTCG